MQIIITGGAGFLGQRLKDALLDSDIAFDELLLADITEPVDMSGDPRIKTRKVDITDASTAESIISEDTRVVFHLAAVVSSQAETDFDLGWRVNVDATRNLLQRCRHARPGIRFIFASSLAVYGGKLPAVVDDTTAVTPQSSYGMEKAIGELMVNDYSRRKFLDGCALRLPTICVRPGKPNQAASSFVSSIIREPLNGEDAVCPVSPNLPLWLSSPQTVIKNLLHAMSLNTNALGPCRTVNLPGIGVTVQQMLQALERNVGDDIIRKIAFKEDPAIMRIVSSWPSHIDNGRALDLGFQVDSSFDDFIQQYRTFQKQVR
ncbi:MAG TPA: D-erythronate dehydrogenase [Chryseosolibacter sp.]|nr:D-erythronate dehydrogenase [Chryseosolibacter sp.]